MHITVTVDNREKSSGVPRLLAGKNITLKMAQLSVGDYMINDEIVIERKTKEDFVQSIISGRLFDQCARLVKTGMRPLILIEGNPFATGSNISPESVQGAWLSVNLSWQIPIVLSEGKEDTVRLLIMAAKQQIVFQEFIRRKGKKPKKIQNQQHYFVQSLPGIGPAIAHRLLNYFSTLEKMVEADCKTLEQVEGIGRQKAQQLYRFFRTAGENR